MLERELGMALTLVLLIRVGQTLLIAGCVRSKNVADTAVRCTLDLAVLLLATWAVAGAFAPIALFATNRDWFDWHNLFGNGSSLLTVMAVLPAATVCTGGVLGAIAERTRLLPLLITSAITAAVSLPLLMRFGHWAGASGQKVDTGLIVATIGGGAAALAMTYVVGARKGKFNRDLSVNYVPGHAVLYQIVGLLLLAAGWCAVSTNPVHTALGFAAALLAGFGFARFKFGKTDVGLLVAAGVGGLAAACLASASPDMHDRLGGGGASAVIAGLLAGVAVPWAVIACEVRLRTDDVTGVSASYLVGGTAGVIVTVVTRPFGNTNAFATLAADLALWLASIVVFGGLAFAVAKLAARRGRLRVTETVEYDGLDLSELDVNAYPDFQQTMIKSHHLRQL